MTPIIPTAIYSDTEVISLLQLKAKNQKKQVHFLFRSKRIKSRKVSHREGYRTLGQSIIDYLTLKGVR